MRALIIIFLTAVSLLAHSQTNIEEKFGTEVIGSISMEFDYPQSIKVESWKGKEVIVKGTAKINGGKDDREFVLRRSISGDRLELKGTIPELKKLQNPVTAIDGKDTLRFESKTEFESYRVSSGRKFSTVNMGPDIRIHLHILVPENIPVSIDSKYGFVEISGMPNLTEVNATYGGIEAFVDRKVNRSLILETNYGKIFADPSLKFQSLISKDFHSKVRILGSNGLETFLSSKYGNIYLKK
ncbi:hypothetical protein [Sphingobacterium hotanense]|uniref:hypothetical protein n=1 Tax=Sphingobacterium hotanense TaxID=649196 RepID=UPI0021A6B005|nr:hypothetical protein [Sphingobacterium hotanense]MCT1526109.1 hypothetical protein [Sphingobacterium hotanense]